MITKQEISYRVYHQLDGESEELSLHAIGEVATRGSITKFSFTEDFGEGQKVNTTITYVKATKSVKLSRSGPVEMVQKFVVDKQMTGKYVTPYGELRLDTNTTLITYENNELHFNYIMFVNGEDMGEYKVTLIHKDIE